MSKLITLVDMMKYSGASTAAFPAGTILTPSAKDWASEQGITVTIGGPNVCNDMLSSVVDVVIAQFRASGKPLCKTEITATVEEVLRRING